MNPEVFRIFLSSRYVRCLRIKQVISYRKGDMMNLKYLDPKKIEIKNFNPRKIDEKSSTFKALCETVRRVGVNIPIHVCSNGNGGYTLFAGERRLRAVLKCGLDEIPAIVQDGNKAVDITYLENFQRKDLTMLEKIKMILILKREKTTADKMMNLLCLDKKDFKLAMNMVENLNPNWLKSIEKNPDYWQAWDEKFFRLIARQPSEIQDFILLKYCKWGVNNHSFVDLQESISKYNMKISNIPWPMDMPIKAKYDLVNSKSKNTKEKCSECLDKSSCQKELFPEIVSDKDALCLNQECFYAKFNGYLLIRLAEHLKKHEKLVGLLPADAWKYDIDISDAVTEQLEAIYENKNHVEMCGRSDKKAIVAMRLLGKSAGKLCYEKLRKHLQPQKKKPVKKKVSSMKLSEKMALLKTKRWHETIERFQKVLEKLEYKDYQKPMRVHRLAMILGIRRLCYPCCAVGMWDRFEKSKEKPTEDEMRVLFEQVIDSLVSMLHQDPRISVVRKGHVGLVEKIAKEFNIDIKTIFDEVSKSKGFTVPKSWRK